MRESVSQSHGSRRILSFISNITFPLLHIGGGGNLLNAKIRLKSPTLPLEQATTQAQTHANNLIEFPPVWALMRYAFTSISDWVEVTQLRYPTDISNDRNTMIILSVCYPWGC